MTATGIKLRQSKKNLTAGESENNQDVEHEELQYIEHHSTERDLQRAQVRVDAEDVDQLEAAEDVGGGEQAFGQQHGVPGVPLLARLVPL